MQSWSLASGTDLEGREIWELSGEHERELELGSVLKDWLLRAVQEGLVTAIVRVLSMD